MTFFHMVIRRFSRMRRPRDRLVRSSRQVIHGLLAAGAYTACETARVSGDRRRADRE
jgi:hypothetical protein